MNRRVLGTMVAAAVAVIIAAGKLRGLRKFTNLSAKRGYTSD
jgi:hypothetical protein